MALRIMAVEMAGDHIRAAMAERARDSFQLLETFENERAEDEPDLAPALTRLVAAAGKPDIVISAIPGELVAHRVLTLPFKDARKLRQVVPFALEEHLPFPIEDAVTAFTRIGQDGDAALVLAAVVRKSDLRSHLDLLAKAGLDPKTVTLGALALAKLLYRASETARNGRGPCAHLVLNIDQARTSLVLIDPSGAPRALRTLPAGLEPNGADALPPRVTATIVSAARQALLAHASDLEPPELLIAGPAAEIPGVRSEIAGELAAAIRDGGTELDALSASENLPSDWLRFGACVAMLLAEAPLNPIEVLNFRQDEFVFRGRNLDAIPLRTTALLAAGVVLMAVLHVVLTTATSVRQLSALDRQVETLAAPALGAKRAAQVPGALRDGIATMHTQLKLMAGGGARSSPLEVLFALSQGVPAKLQVEFSDIQIDSGSVKMDGEADSFGVIDQVKRALSENPNFSDIEVNDAKVTGNSGKVDFHLSASLGEARGGGE